MKTIQLVLISLLFALMVHATSSRAEDTDIYSGLGGAAGKPNVLIVFDNAANFSSNAAGSSCVINGVATALSGTVGGIEQCAFYNVINALPDDVVNIGMMVYNANNIRDINNANCGGSNGGCLVVPLTTMSAANKPALLAWIKTWVTTGGAGNGYIKSAGEATAATMQEAWAYYAGSTGLSGRSYSGIQPASGCQQNFVIFIGNSFSSSGSPGDGGATSPASALASAPGVTAAQTALITTTYATSCGTYTFPSSNHESGGYYADEWARYMRQHDLYSAVTETQKITTYTIGLLGASCQAEYAATLTSMANVGGGKYFATTDYDSITQALLKILNEVQAVNSVFSSSSLPVSVNAQGTYLNQIYMGMFRPDASGYPRWVGNLKQYQFVATRDLTTHLINLSLGDSLGIAAISSAGTGFITPNAVSYWTCGGSPSVRACSPVGDPTNGFWVNNPQSAGGAYDLPDGELVEKGGAAQIMRLANLNDDYTTAVGASTNPRKLYTYCPSGASCNATLSAAANAFDRSNTAITDAMLGTGPQIISSITSAATVQASGLVPSSSGVAATVSITAFSKSGSTVTASASATDLARLAVSSQLNIATGAAKYDCNPCTVTAIGGSSFNYTNAGGSGTPSVPYVASIYTNFVAVTSNSHNLNVGQTVTLSSCTTYTTLNGTVATVTTVTDANHFVLGTAVSTVGATSDAGCRYSPNTATVTTSSSHGFPAGALITIAGATPSGYNGTWSITVTGTTTFTFQYTAAAPLASFSGAGATATNSTTTRDLLTRWVRGEDNFGDELGPGGSITVRPSVHGDVLHSRPVVINYGGSTGVVVYYGANDGVYRAVNGNQTNPSGSTLPVPGSELWGFIPTEFFGKLLRQRTNSPQLLLPSTPSGILPAPARKDYFADGSTGVYQLLNANGTTNTAYIYMAMRRGGRLIYAMDVSTPTNPQFLWKIDSTGLTTPSGFTASTDFAELGQTWSAPKVASVAGYANPVLIFGAGYDTAEDAEPPATDSMGRGIFIVDAVTGALVWSATTQPSGATACSGSTTRATCLVSGMNYSIPADITLVDRDGDGKIDRLYAADVGGNVWRVDLQPTAAHTTPNYWQVNKLAALGCYSGACASGTTPRKFFYPVDVVPTSSYDAVIGGQGDREHPLFRDASVSIRNRIYMLKDLHTGNDGSGGTVITRTNLFNATSTPYDGTLSGYFISLGDGEKVVNAPLTVAGYTYLGTNQPVDPTANSCSVNLGIARGYKLAPLTGTYTSSTFSGGGLPPSPVAGVVSVMVNGVSTLVPFVIGGGGDPDCTGVDCSSAFGGGKPTINVPTSRTRTYWYQEMD